MAGITSNGELGSDQIIPFMESNIGFRAARYLEEVGRPPTLSIVCGNPNSVPSARYMSLKHKIGGELGILVDTTTGTVDEISARIEADNTTPNINGTIVQLPLREEDWHLTDDLLASVVPAKDVDGLAPNSPFVPATVRAVEAWFEGHSIDYMAEPVALIGLGRLVNGPFYKRLREQGAQAVEAFDKDSPDLEKIRGINESRIIVSATGIARLLTPDLFLPDTTAKVLVDVGTAEQSGAQQGDVSDELRQHAIDEGWVITPKRGGIGKITVRALLANLMDAAEKQAGITEPLGHYRLMRSLEATSSNRTADSFSSPKRGAYIEAP